MTPPFPESSLKNRSQLVKSFDQELKQKTNQNIISSVWKGPAMINPNEITTFKLKKSDTVKSSHQLVKIIGGSIFQVDGMKIEEISKVDADDMKCKKSSDLQAEGLKKGDEAETTKSDAETEVKDVKLKPELQAEEPNLKLTPNKPTLNLLTLKPPPVFKELSENDSDRPASATSLIKSVESLEKFNKLN